MKRSTEPRITAKRAGHLLTFTRNVPGIEISTLTIDLAAPPKHPYDAQKWFISLLGSIWWDLTEPESFNRTTRVADVMTTLVKLHRAERDREVMPDPCESFPAVRGEDTRSSGAIFTCTACGVPRSTEPGRCPRCGNDVGRWQEVRP